MVGTDGRGGLREGEIVVGTGGGGGRGARPRRCSSSCRSRRVGSLSCPPSVSSLCPPCVSSSCPPSVFSSFSSCIIVVLSSRVVVHVGVRRRDRHLIMVWCNFYVVGVMVHVVVWWSCCLYGGAGCVHKR